MSIKTLDDKELIVSYINGNHQAFEVLLMRHKSRIYNLIYLKVKDRDVAEDIFQDTFIKIINTFNLGNYNEEGKFLPWAMRIAHNLVIDFFRKSNKMKLVSETSSRSSDFNIFSVLSSDAPNKLQEMSRAELVDQMMNLMEISINTALGRMRYALLNMRKLIDKHQLITDVA